MKDLLLITPPFTQLNTPYPATAYLKGFLNTRDISSFQMDLGIEVILKLFSKETLAKVFERAEINGTISSENAQRIWSLREEYLQIVDEIICFLQGKSPSMARQICSENFLPRASRFEQMDDLDWAFGNMGTQDRAKHLATHFLEDISDFIIECVDENFGFSRYAERLGKSANSFDELYQSLQDDLTFIDELTLESLRSAIDKTHPKLICFSVPFPGNLYSAFRCGQFIKENYPEIKTAMGGGFPNTELRSVNDARVFSFFDFITLDDGELPIELLHEHITRSDIVEPFEFKRTFTIVDGEVTYLSNTTRNEYKQHELGTPDYSDLLLDDYISVIEMANPMHSLWSDGRWNKLTMAHGCYWGKCTFCDISLDYIKIYEPLAAKTLVDRVEKLIEQTGENGFHFVDEAAPPALMKAFALEILKRGITITWWTNIRFEKNFTADLCRLLKASGCIAVSGGLEVASDRLLALIDKGITVEQVARVTRNFTETGIMVHSYLMYGYPTQTIQETVDSLEMVRQMFECDVLQSGFWHQFALTAHSPIGLDPDTYGILPVQNEISFANNDIDFKDSTGIDHSIFSYGLKKSLFNFMHGVGFEIPLQNWFDFEIPGSTIHPSYIQQCLEGEIIEPTKPNGRIVWLGHEPMVRYFKKSRKGTSFDMMGMQFHSNTDMLEIELEQSKGEWLLDLLDRITPNSPPLTYKQIKADYEDRFEIFEMFWHSRDIEELKTHALLAV